MVSGVVELDLLRGTFASAGSCRPSAGRLPRSGSSAGFAPLPVAVVALAGIRNRCCPIRSVSGLLQQSAQVDGQLPIDVFASRGRDCFRLGSQSHGELAVVLMGDGSNFLEHREDLARHSIFPPAGKIFAIVWR